MGNSLKNIKSQIKKPVIRIHTKIRIFPYHKYVKKKFFYRFYDIYVRTPPIETLTVTVYQLNFTPIY